MSIYHALINALSAHMIHINLNILYTRTDVEHSPTKTIYIKYYNLKKKINMHARAHAHWLEQKLGTDIRMEILWEEEFFSVWL